MLGVSEPPILLLLHLVGTIVIPPPLPSSPCPLSITLSAIFASVDSMALAKISLAAFVVLFRTHQVKATFHSNTPPLRSLLCLPISLLFSPPRLSSSSPSCTPLAPSVLPFLSSKTSQHSQLASAQLLPSLAILADRKHNSLQLRSWLGITAATAFRQNR